MGWRYDQHGEFQYGEFRMRVTHIKFDWQDNEPGHADEFRDGFTLMHGFDNPLDHMTDDPPKSKGEWIYKYILGEEGAGRSEPALYVAGKGTSSKPVTVMARIECAAPIHSAWIGAKEVLWRDGANPQPHQWMDVKKTEVEFMDISGNETLYVSKGLNGSQYVSLPLYMLTGTGEVFKLKDSIDRSEIIWQWYVDSVMGTPTSSVLRASDSWGDDTIGWRINKSGKYDGEGENEVVHPHKFYTVLDVPKKPWYKYNLYSELDDPTAYPWVSALDFCTRKRDGLSQAEQLPLDGVTSIEAAATLAAHQLYSLATYDHQYGRSYYIPLYDENWGPTGFLGVPEGLDAAFDLTKFLDPPHTLPGRTVCGADLAMALAIFVSLIGGDATYYASWAFGYIQPSHICGSLGGNQCNNPFFASTYLEDLYVPVPLVDPAHTAWRRMPGNYDFRNRSMVSDNHGFVKILISGGAEQVYDPTFGNPTPLGHPRIIGPVLDADGNISQTPIQNYYSQVVDLGGGGPPPAELEDNLIVASRRVSFGPINLREMALNIMNDSEPDPYVRHGMHPHTRNLYLR